MELRAPVLNAAGSLGFAPDPHGPSSLERFGAFVTNPLSPAPRAAAQGERLLEFPGGFLLHTGHPNPGLRAALRRYGPRWGRADLPLIVHLLSGEPGEVREMVERLETVEGVMAVELGLPHEVEAAAAAELARAALGELPLVVRLPLERAAGLAPAVAEAGAGTVSLGPPRGALPGPDGSLVQGRLYGPALFPQALRAVREIAAMGIPVIGAGGVYSQEQIEAMLEAGALAVQLDAVLWRGGLEPKI